MLTASSSMLHRAALRAPSFAGSSCLRRPCAAPTLARAARTPPKGELSAVGSRRTLYIPTVIDETSRGEHHRDLYSKLLKERTIHISEVEDRMSTIIVASLLYLDAVDSSKPIHMYINSPGGVVTSGLAIYDTMQHIKSEVHTFCIGQAASMGSLLLCGGAPGHRYILPNARVMIHQPSGGSSGTASDFEISANEILRIREALTLIYQNHCGLEGESVEDGKARFERALERDNFMTAEQAKAFNLVDHVVQSRKKVDEKEGEQNDPSS